MRIPTFFEFKSNSELISQQFEQLDKLIIQSTTGKKIQASSEDPVLAAEIKSQHTFIKGIKNYYDNSVLAQSRSQLFSIATQNSINAVGDIQSQIMKVQGGILSDKDLANIAQKLQGDLSLLLGYANTTDADGSYIFSGFNTNVAAYGQSGGSYQYQGGLSQGYIDIAQGVNALYNESGFNVFGNIFNGNGTFTINASSSNTGSATTSAGSIVDQTAYVPDTYTLSFVTMGGGQLGYQVQNSSGGQVIPPTQVSGSPLTVNFLGLSFEVDGQPQAGDTFTIQPSTQQNVFNSLQNLITLLSSPSSNQAIFSQGLSQLSATFSQVSSHLITYQSQIGTMSSAINDQMISNKSDVNNAKVLLEGLQEAPLEQVMPAIAQKQFALEATMGSYQKLQETLMQLLKL